jgi:hypothetical protein
LSKLTSLAVIVLWIVVFSVAIVAGALAANQQIQNIGKIKTVGVGVYQDQGCTLILTQIDWGTLSPGDSKNFTGYARNEGNVVGSLYMSVSNWSPANASSFITCTWDAQNKTLSAGVVLPVTFMLRVSTSISGVKQFSFLITVVVTG